jgi:hypothetical protein
MRLVHYSVLAFILLLGGILFLRFQYYPSYQFLIVVGTVLGYVLWGVSYHKSESRFLRRVILEYLLLGFVVILMFAAALNIRL